MHIFNVMNNRLLDDVETGGGDTQGHGMVLALHLVKHLKSFRKFSELLTKKYHAICNWLRCLHPFHEQITVSTCVSMEDKAGCVCTWHHFVAFAICSYCLVHIQAICRRNGLGLTVILLLMCSLPQGFSEPRLHPFFFMLPKSAEAELCTLYRHVRNMMVAVHKGTKKVECLVRIADEW